MRLHVQVLPDRNAIGRRAAQIVAGELLAGRLRTFGVATGSSPLSAYEQLAALGLPGWSGVEVFALDEYVGLAPDAPTSYRSVIEEEVRGPLGLDPDRVHVPDGGAADLAAACEAYERALQAAGGVDLQLLGIGATGHIGFNEPGSPFDSRTRVVELSPRTRSDNARFFDSPEDVPHQAVTQGIATIGSARRHLLIARGPQKAEAVRAALEDAPSPACPASALQGFDHVDVLLDPEAAARLTPDGPAWRTDGASASAPGPGTPR